jgi:hypothetical protein
LEKQLKTERSRNIGNDLRAYCNTFQWYQALIEAELYKNKEKIAFYTQLPVATLKDAIQKPYHELK